MYATHAISFLSQSHVSATGEVSNILSDFHTFTFSHLAIAIQSYDTAMHGKPSLKIIFCAGIVVE